MRVSGLAPRLNRLIIRELCPNRGSRYFLSSFGRSSHVYIEPDTRGPRRSFLIRRTEFPLSVYGRSAARVWPMVRDQVNPRISRFGCAPVRSQHLPAYTTEMLKAFRTETGEPLDAAL
jgi:hypothetical protein